MTRQVQLPAPGRGAYDRSQSRAERQAEHRERLLLAAGEVLRDGKLTVAKIVERAGVSRSTFYEFFDSPEHLLLQLEQRALGELQPALESALSRARTPLERVRSVTRAWLEVIETRATEARVALTPSDGADSLSSAGRLLLLTLTRLAQLSRSEGAGWSASDDAYVLAAAAAVETLSRRHLGATPKDDAHQIMTDIIWRLLR